VLKYPRIFTEKEKKMNKLILTFLAAFALASLGENRAEASPWVTPQLETETGVRVRVGVEKIFLLPTLRYSSVFGRRGHVFFPSLSLVRKLKYEDWLVLKLGLAYDPSRSDPLGTTIGAEKKETVLYGFVSFYGKQELTFFNDEKIAHGFYSGDFVLLVPTEKNGELGLRKMNTPLGRTILEMDVVKENRMGMNPLKINVGLHAEHFGWDVAAGPHVGLSRYRCNWNVQLQYLQGKIRGKDGRTARLTGSWYF